jgi:predicted AAA+ superfamily ATPase
LLAKVKKYLIGKGLVIISSLRATGKTLLLQLIRNEILIEGVVYFYTKFSKNVDPFVQLEEDAGISYDSRGNRWSMPQDQANQKMVLIIDNAHYQYENSNFWEGC